MSAGRYTGIQTRIRGEDMSRVIWRILKLTVAVIFVFGLFIAGYEAYKIAHYKTEEPVITAKEQLVFPPGSEVKLSDIAEFENCTDKEISSAQWEDGGHEKLAIMSDGSSLMVGEKTGKLNVMIKAKGERKDISQEIQITIK